ncbi:MAG: hypothetical protein DHS20C14_22750 [Phycisphaeraceae bacterium]|nr:MAG: hypothetical protein DHS20C14_22750 [Phycisphaeraceae bacterium]
MTFGDLASQIVQDEEKFIPALIAGAIVIGLTVKTIGRVISGVSRERTKREIAAYIAEGSITPEHGERVLKADSNKNRCC